VGFEKNKIAIADRKTPENKIDLLIVKVLDNGRTGNLRHHDVFPKRKVVCKNIQPFILEET
jgi:hypothetical protein